MFSLVKHRCITTADQFYDQFYDFKPDQFLEIIRPNKTSINLHRLIKHYQQTWDEINSTKTNNNHLKPPAY